MSNFAKLILVIAFMAVGVSSVDAKDCKIVAMSVARTTLESVKSDLIVAGGYCKVVKMSEARKITSESVADLILAGGYCCIGCNGQSTCGNNICVSCNGQVQCC
jgi:hypothetical protein